jgi:CRP/FNR family transcriptional regulator, nitrogen oxide reductase regulator
MVSGSITEFENAVRHVAVFKNATNDDVHVIAGMGIQRAVEEDSYFFFQGEKADYLHILLSGHAKLCMISADGQQVNLRTLVPHQLFGAIGAVQADATYPACAQALEDSTSLAIASADFALLLKERPHLSFGMMRLMTGYIQEMQERYRELATERVEQRVARALLRLAAQSGKRTEQGGIDLTFSRQDLAEMTGTTLYTVSRCLSTWEKKGIISTGRERVTLVDPHGLVRVADDLVK